MRLVRENLYPLAVALGALLLAVGAIVVVRAPTWATAGWFTSTTTSAEAVAVGSLDTPGFQMVSTELLWGLGVGASGLVVLVAALAHEAGVRRGRRERPGATTQA
jgi:hypothetical protein